MVKDNRVRDILAKYGGKIEQQIDTSSEKSYSRDYVKFKEEMAPDFTRYEKWCKSLGNIIKLKVPDKDANQVKKHLDVAHIDVEPSQAMALALMSFLSIFLIGSLISLGIFLITLEISGALLLFFILTILLSVFVYYFVGAYPQRLANKWRLKASSQMVPAVLYVVVYMRHTSNLERAIAFAAQNLDFPLALDFRKVFYNVEVGKFSTIKESLDHYLESWRDYAPEFIEAFHLIQSSLFEPNDARRVSTLEKSLQVVLDGVYDKMLRFTREVRSPLTNVYMLGVVLPTLGLALLPLASAMIGEVIKWYHVFLLFNFIVPFLVFYLTDKILFLRPGGYGNSTLLERNPEYYKYSSKKPYIYAFLITSPLLLIGLLPLIFGYTPIPGWLGIPNDPSFSSIGMGFLGDMKIFDFKTSELGNTTGPFGIGALVMSLFIPLGIAIFFSVAFSIRTKDLIVQRENTEKLEREFNNSLFQLGNRIGNGTPPEVAFGLVSQSSKGLMTEDFFRRVNYNIAQMGMNVEKAVFDKNRGAIMFYPSDLIATSMQILIESSKKGLKIAAISLMSISEYVKNIGKITERLRDMLAEIVSDMKSNMTFLAPLLSGIVIGLSVMITSILSRLTLSQFAQDESLGFSFSGIISLFNVSSMIPSYFVQISVGIYLIQIIFILTGVLVTIDSGEDKLQKTNKTSKNLMAGMVFYFVAALISSLILFGLSAIVLGNLTG